MSPITELIGGAKAYGWGSLVASPPAFESIATNLLSVATTTITFSSIPSTYTNLQLRYIIRANSDTNTRMRLRFNGDSNANYSIHLLEGAGDGGIASFAGADTSSTIGSANTQSSNIANAFAVGIIDILQYKNTNINKTVRSISGSEYNNDGKNNSVTGLWEGVWRNTSAVDSITLLMDNGVAFAPNSSLALYGIKGVQ